jgi:hypothetical protein
MRRWLGLTAALVLTLAVVGCSSDDDNTATEGTDETSAPPAGDTEATEGTEAGGDPAALPDGYEGYQSEVYADDVNWLCRPGKADDVCAAVALDTTVVEADGTAEVETFVPAEDPPVDCFYVYPTISADPSANSDLVPGPEERLIVASQAARLAEVCRVYAPMYRQNTLGSMTGAIQSDLTREERGAIAYGDVADAWKQYMANDNDGRGVVLIGHSQGSGMLNQLIAEEIDEEPLLRDRLLSAMLIGTSVAVPEGEDVGGDFQNVPLCRSADQVGCVITYASFRDTSPPPEDTFFGLVRDGAEGMAGCTNPAALGGGSGALSPYFLSSEAAYADPAANEAITTEFIAFPDFLTAECVERDGVSYLEVHVDADPSDPRADDIGGDLTPQWGLHAADINLAMGNLIELIKSQTSAYSEG